MGGFMVFHWLIVIGFFVVAITAIVVVVRRGCGGSRESVEHRNATLTATPPPGSAEARLKQLDALRSKRLITDAGYAQRRAGILQSL